MNLIEALTWRVVIKFADRQLMAFLGPSDLPPPHPSPSQSDHKWIKNRPFPKSCLKTPAPVLRSDWERAKYHKYHKLSFKLTIIEYVDRIYTFFRTPRENRQGDDRGWRTGHGIFAPAKMPKIKDEHRDGGRCDEESVISLRSRQYVRKKNYTFSKW